MFDPILHNPLRSKIVALLSTHEKLAYKTLKDETTLTDGNLAGYLKSLEEAGYIEYEKLFEGRKPKTIYKLTQKGKEAFLNYIEALKNFIKEHG
jgi:DNA-binding PadR family transcriptional regulator